MKLEVLLCGTVCKPGSALLQGYVDNLRSYTALLSCYFEAGVMLLFFSFSVTVVGTYIHHLNNCLKGFSPMSLSNSL